MLKGKRLKSTKLLSMMIILMIMSMAALTVNAEPELPEGTPDEGNTVITTAVSISDATVSGISDKTYSGKAQTQKPVVKMDLNGEELTLAEGTDYTISYSNNVKAGTATVIINGVGDFTGSVKKTFKIKAKAIKPKVSLAKTAYTYSGNVIKPKVTVKNGSTTLAASNYKVTYAAGRKAVGTYKVTVRMKGNYSGSKTVSFKINPKGTNVSGLSAGKKAFTVTWRKQATRMAGKYIGGYQLQYSRDKNFKSGNKTTRIAGYKKASRKVSGLKAKTKYYVRVRTYKKVGKTTYYSPWSTAKAVTTPAVKKANTAASSSGVGSTVYWTPNGTVYHASRNCSTLSRSKTVYSGTISQSGKPRVCKVCGH